MHYLFTDGGSRGNPGPAATGYLLFDEETLITSDGKFLGVTTNNTAEYTALISGLNAAISHGVKNLTCKLDSELVVKQINGQYKVKHPQIQQLHAEVKKLISQFAEIKFVHVPRAQNAKADAIVNQTLDAQAGSI